MFLSVCVERKREMGWRDMSKKLVGWASWVSFVWKLLSIRLNTNCSVQVEKQGRTREHRWIRHEERRKAHMTRVKWKGKKITNFKKRSLNSGMQNFIYFVLQWVGWLERERERGSVVLERTKYQSASKFFISWILLCYQKTLVNKEAVCFDQMCSLMMERQCDG